MFDDQIEQLIKDHMPELVALITVEEGKVQIDKHFVDIKKQADTFLGEKVTQVKTMAQQPITHLDDVVKDVKSQIDKEIPGGVTAVEKLKGDKLENIMGVDSVKGKLKGFVEQATKQVDVKKNQAVKELDNQKEGVKNQLEKERPKIPIYDQLPGFIQKEVYSQAKEKGKDEIDKRKAGWINSLKDKADISKLAANITDVPAIKESKGMLDSKKKEFTALFEDIKKLTSAGGMFSAAADKIGGFF